jgi:hypothetical protein
MPDFVALFIRLATFELADTGPNDSTPIPIAPRMLKINTTQQTLKLNYICNDLNPGVFSLGDGTTSPSKCCSKVI